MARYFMFNKPRGCVTARRDARHKTVMDYFPEDMRDVIFPIGRLDKDTEGLLLFTDDGNFFHHLMRPEFHVPKTYYFVADGIPNEEKLGELESGVNVYKNRDKMTAPAQIEILETCTLRDVRHLLDGSERIFATKRGDFPAICGNITITEGKKHQVKRMIRYTGPRVVYLKRVAIGALSLDPDLSPGEYRTLTDEELSALM